MRKIAIICLLALLASCEEDAGYTISGTYENAPEGQQIFISELNEDNNQTTIIDTVEVVDGKFELDLPEKEAPKISFLTVEGTRGNVLYIADNTPISFEIYGDSLYASEVTGGKDNKILYDYLATLREDNKELTALRNEMMAAFQSQDSTVLTEIQERRKELVDMALQEKVELVEAHPNSIVSLMVLQDILNSQMVSTSEVRELYESLSPQIKETGLAETIDEAITNMSLVEIGGKAPNFSAPTPEGGEISLNDAMGEVTLIDFWASWCKPCREENPNIVNVYEKYHDKGLNIIGVSLDRPGQKDKWLQAIEEDNLAWNQVSNLMFWQDPIAQQYGVRAIPAAFLLDENGVIVAKDLRGEDLENKVAELLEEE